jgi:hypothetical protein
MEIQEALGIMRKLADGIHPESGKILASQLVAQLCVPLLPTACQRCLRRKRSNRLRWDHGFSHPGLADHRQGQFLERLHGERRTFPKPR